MPFGKGASSFSPQMYYILLSVCSILAGIICIRGNSFIFTVFVLYFFADDGLNQKEVTVWAF